MDNHLQYYVQFLRALANEERLGILEIIENQGQITVSEVEKKFFMEQSTASHHMNILKKADIVESRKAGRNIFYTIKEEHLNTFYQEFLENLHKKAQAKDTSTSSVSNIKQ